MGQVIVDISPSIDGYVAGRNISVDKPFGDAGHRLHRWIGYESAIPTPADQEAGARMFANAGAVVLGRRMFDVGIGTWGDDGAFGMPSFVVTSRPRQDLVKGPTTFRFVTDGVAQAMCLAQEAAGNRNVVVVGGADVVRQCLAAGHVHTLHLHLVPVILGAGTPLFSGETPRYDLETTSVTTTPHATHLTYTVKR
ncbi:dihydrofolate reductase family protein [Streptomyces sp. NPDC058644]|uniref:dihydrofolate reductase family protein n=1 Tax=unclassified Streptomyces TaxID=2593676 RepID=UPI0036629535